MRTKNPICKVFKCMRAAHCIERDETHTKNERKVETCRGPAKVKFQKGFHKTVAPVAKQIKETARSR